MSIKGGFKNLIPILQDKSILKLLYNLDSQVELESFLSENKVNLSIEEIEKLWDIIEVCKGNIPYKEVDPIRNSNIKINGSEDNSLNKSKLIDDDGLNISGGSEEFIDRLLKEVSMFIGEKEIGSMIE